MLAVGRKARREVHAGEIADDLALAGLDIEQQHLRIAGAESHIGDLLRGGRETRRHDKIVAARQIAHIGAVLVHDREALAAVLRRAGLVDEDDAGIEKALLAGDAREDRIRNDVRDAARIVGVGDILLACDLRARRPRPRGGTRSAAARRRPPAAPGDDELRIDRLPAVELRRWSGLADRCGKRRGIDRREKDRALEIIGDDRRSDVRRRQPSPANGVTATLIGLKLLPGLTLKYWSCANAAPWKQEAGRDPEQEARRRCAA